MKLIGMLDSPYVRRVAISLQLMDSTLILQYAEALAGRSLLPAEPQALAQSLRTVGLALAA